MAPSAPSLEPTLLERAQTFVAENRRAVLIATAAAVVAAGGAAYYISTSRGPGGASDLEKAKKKSKKSKKDAKNASAQNEDAPLLDEVKDGEMDDDTPFTEAQVAAMTDGERKSRSAALKERGNTAYKKKQFEKAAGFYSRAIDVTPKPEPVFYSNRAACYVNMVPPKYDLVVADCDVALSLDKTYLKALNRRAAAHEHLEQLTLALRDFTAATILDKFANETTAASVERVLRKLAASEATRLLADREKRLPSWTFVSAYFAAFRETRIPELPENPSQGDQTLVLGMQALNAADYIHAFTLVNESIEQDISFDRGKAHALNLRGTFKFLIGDVSSAKEDLDASLKLDAKLTQTWVKIASVHMERGDPVSAFAAFDSAIALNAADPDIYYHRGQVLFIMNEFEEAAKNYTQSTELDDDFVFSHIQLAVAQYKGGDVARAQVTFRETLKHFPQRSEPQNYYGELLLDQGRFQEAVEKFDKAIELEKEKTRPNVLPMVNKGLCLYQWTQDMSAAERCCHEALQVDPECEAAVATLAQLALQQGRVPEAVEYFSRQADLARSEPELVNALTYKYASSAQLQFAEEYPEMGTQMSALARTMMETNTAPGA